MTAGVRREGLRFLVAGAVNTAMTYALYLLLLNWLDYTFAYTIAYVAGIVLSYALNTRFVFQVAPTLRGFAAFPLVYLAQYLAGALILNLAVRGFGVPQRFALLASIVVTVPLTFALSRLLLAPKRARAAGSRND
jgi:putative flippase GtrA